MTNYLVWPRPSEVQIEPWCPLRVECSHPAAAGAMQVPSPLLACVWPAACCRAGGLHGHYLLHAGWHVRSPRPHARGSLGRAHLSSSRAAAAGASRLGLRTPTARGPTALVWDSKAVGGKELSLPGMAHSWPFRLYRPTNKRNEAADTW